MKYKNTPSNILALSDTLLPHTNKILFFLLNIMLSPSIMELRYIFTCSKTPNQLNAETFTAKELQIP
jgi:hypothetical protein